MGATLMTARVGETMEDNGDFWSTYGWHPRSVCAARQDARPRPRHHRVGRPGRAGRLLRRSRSGCARAVGRLPRYSSNVSEDERKLCFEILFASVAARPDTREVFAHEA
jgi:hypothetical protein